MDVARAMCLLDNLKCSNITYYTRGVSTRSPAMCGEYGESDGATADMQ